MLIRQLASKLAVKVAELQQAQMPDGKTMATALTSIAAQGNIEQIIPDPVGWQREIRANRHLPNQNQ